MQNAIERMAEAIGYPDPVPRDAVRFDFGVDDGEVRAELTQGGLALVREIWHESEEGQAAVPVRIAELAAGRVFREEAVVAWDEAKKALILWQRVPASLSGDRLRLFFKVFTASCDWWLDRVDEAAAPAPVFPEMMIMP